MNLTWIKCEGNAWCSFERLNLDSIGNTAGVYIIWHDSETPRCVRVGQGDIKDRLSEHRNNPRITQYCSEGGLFVTWAAVPASQHDSVEAFLANECKPLVGERFPERTLIAVNLPDVPGIRAPVGAQALSQFRVP